LKPFTGASNCPFSLRTMTSRLLQSEQILQVRIPIQALCSPQPNLAEFFLHLLHSSNAFNISGHTPNPIAMPRPFLGLASNPFPIIEVSNRMWWYNSCFEVSLNPVICALRSCCKGTVSLRVLFNEACIDKFLGHMKASV